jgi:prevent-host-death family protein
VVREAAVAPAAPVPAGVFKATCLELMDRVRDRREEIVITKYGKPVAKLVPVGAEDTARRTARGWMKGTVLWYGDVISPIDVEWEAMKD